MEEKTIIEINNEVKEVLKKYNVSLEIQHNIVIVPNKVETLEKEDNKDK